ncbi:(2Fe-2S)-binding protein [Arthrobacter citreus]|uniref:(2Fe-2S)-binding protein n=1 Tax=Arthrobacter TaxID=1663 RepID=UPI001FEC15EC|nr:(2Fe-2S)-binding protein [Arthrobacter gandavensis]
MKQRRTPAAAEPEQTPMVVNADFEGRPLQAQAGQTVGAALIGAGIKAWRGTRGAGRPRGLFCGIGVCYDCLVTIDGSPNQRACLAEVTDGMEIRGTLSAEAEATPEQAPTTGDRK